MPPPAALFNLTRKHWLSTTSFHSTTLIVPHPANLPEPSWSKLTLSTRTHEHDEYLSLRPRSGRWQPLSWMHPPVDPRRSPCQPRPCQCPCPYPCPCPCPCLNRPSSSPPHLPLPPLPPPRGVLYSLLYRLCIQLPSRFAIVQADRKRDREIHT